MRVDATHIGAEAAMKTISKGWNNKYIFLGSFYSHQLNYSVIKKEALSLIWALLSLLKCKLIIPTSLFCTLSRNQTNDDGQVPLLQPDALDIKGSNDVVADGQARVELLVFFTSSSYITRLGR